MYITYCKKNNFVYASKTTSIRVDGKVVKKFETLGRVLDQERSIFMNRERGIFTYDVKTDTYGEPPADFVAPVPISRNKKKADNQNNFSRLVLRFGDVFFYFQFISSLKLFDVINKINFSNKDTLQALICYYVITSKPNYLAETWYELSYARILWPCANMSHDSIYETLSLIGKEENNHIFFDSYYEFIKTLVNNDEFQSYDISINNEKETTMISGILMDIEGIPYASKIEEPNINNSNFVICKDFKFLFAMQQSTGIPLNYRFSLDNVIVATTVKEFFFQLNKIGIDIKYSLLDAGYYNKSNADELIKYKIPFITRIANSHTIFKDTFDNCRSKLETPENCFLYKGRIFYIQTVEVKLGLNHDHLAYGYFCLDLTKQNGDRTKLTEEAIDQNFSSVEVHNKFQTKGLFMLVATNPIAKTSVIEFYFSKNQIEDLLKINSSPNNMLPVHIINNKEILKGHMIMSFIAAVINKILSLRLLNHKININQLFSTLEYQSAFINRDQLITSKPTEIMNEIYELFKIKCPVEIPYKTNDDLQ